jgi:hypothetical protein
LGASYSSALTRQRSHSDILQNGHGKIQLLALFFAFTCCLCYLLSSLVKVGC